MGFRVWAGFLQGMSKVSMRFIAGGTQSYRRHERLVRCYEGSCRVVSVFVYG